MMALFGLLPKRGPSASVILRFDGSVSHDGNPLQQAACAYAAHITLDANHTGENIPIGSQHLLTLQTHQYDSKLPSFEPVRPTLSTVATNCAPTASQFEDDFLAIHIEPSQMRHRVQGRSHLLTNSLPIGHCSSLEAKYVAVIFALRSVISFLQSQNVRQTFVNLKVIGDAHLVDTIGGRFKSVPDTLEALHTLAKSLTERFFFVSYIPCTGSANKAVGELAQRARTAVRFDEAQAVYAPSIASLLPVRVEGKQCVATHDIGKEASQADPNNFIDAAYLRTLPNGNALFLGMNCAAPFSVLLSDASFLTVLGSVNLDLQIRWPKAIASARKRVEFFVVQNLPVPVHVSTRHPVVPDPPFDRRSHFRAGDYPEFHREELPPLYAKHEFWNPARHLARQAHEWRVL